MSIAPRAFSFLGVLAVLIALPGRGMAQGGERVSGGISMGVNEARFTDPSLFKLFYGPADFTPAGRIDARLSAFLDIAIRPRFALRVEAAYSKMGAGYRDVSRPPPFTEVWDEYAVTLAYIEVPLLARMEVLVGRDVEGGSALSLLVGPALAFKALEEHRVAYHFPDDPRGTLARVYLDDELRAFDLRFVTGTEGRIEIRGRVFTLDLRLARGLRKAWRKVVGEGHLSAPQARNRVISLSVGTLLF